MEIEILRHNFTHKNGDTLEVLAAVIDRTSYYGFVTIPDGRFEFSDYGVPDPLVIGELSDEDIIDNLVECITKEYDDYLKIKANLKQCEGILRQFPQERDCTKMVDKAMATIKEDLPINFLNGLKKELTDVQRTTDRCGYEYTVMKSRLPHIYPDRMKEFVDIAKSAQKDKKS